MQKLNEKMMPVCVIWEVPNHDFQAPAAATARLNIIRHFRAN